MEQEQKTPDFERLKDKVVKIYNLAADERGDEQTRLRAQEALEKLLKQYNLVIEDIIKPEGKVKRYKFKWNNVQQAYLLRQLWGMVMESNRISWWHNGYDKTYEFELTEYKFVDLSELYKYYNAFLQKEYNSLSEDISILQKAIKRMDILGRNYLKKTADEFVYRPEVEELLGNYQRRRRTLAQQIIHKYELFPPSDGEINDKVPTKEELAQWYQIQADMARLSKMPRHTLLDKTKLLG